MNRKRLKNFLLIAGLVVATGAAMAYSSNSTGVFSLKRLSDASQNPLTNTQILSVSADLVQNKVLQGSEGTFGLNLTLQAEAVTPADNPQASNVDMVIVLDRSGSMKGAKINDARQAVLKLLPNLTPNDRFALVTYSDGVHINSGLLNVTPGNRTRMESAVRSVRVGGGTNLGAGLQAGIDLIRSSEHTPNAAKVILISDGLANKGITEVRALSGIAATAVEKEFAVSTVGVGNEFNEYLMSAIADHGTGSYYYLENPAAFAEVFQNEFLVTRLSIVNHLKIQIPLKDGIRLTDAAGYPLNYQNGQAVFYPGSLRSGQSRTLYLTLRVPTDNQREFKLNDIKIAYTHDNQVYETVLEDSFSIACLTDRRKVLSSIDKLSWSEKVINEDFNRLKQEVAGDLKSGKKHDAMKRIKKYYGEQQALNATVGSARVAENLDKDLKELETVVEETFKGAPTAIRQKQKSNAKALQYDGYQGRRK